MFRLHGARKNGDTNECGSTGGPNEIWEFGDVAYGIISDIMLTRDALRPYISTYWKDSVQSSGIPLLRPLFFDYQDEAVLSSSSSSSSRSTDDTFLFGKHWLVAPVYTFGSRERTLYLPRLDVDEVWVYYYNMTLSFEGGQWLESFPAPLQEFPLFFKSRGRDSLSISIAAKEIGISTRGI